MNSESEGFIDLGGIIQHRIVEIEERSSFGAKIRRSLEQCCWIEKTKITSTSTRDYKVMIVIFKFLKYMRVGVFIGARAGTSWIPDGW